MLKYAEICGYMWKYAEICVNMCKYVDMCGKGIEHKPPKKSSTALLARVEWSDNNKRPRLFQKAENYRKNSFIIIGLGGNLVNNFFWSKFYPIFL